MLPSSSPIHLTTKGHFMIIFDIRLGRFTILAQRETVAHTFKVTREGPGEVIIDLPYVSIFLTNESRARTV
jgi:hypothetical protein